MVFRTFSKDYMTKSDDQDKIVGIGFAGVQNNKYKSLICQVNRCITFLK